MITALLVVFTIGYLAIVFEEVIHLNKTASALVCGILCWLILVVAPPTGAHMEAITHGHGAVTDWTGFVKESLGHHLVEICEILFFLLGAMTIVELVDAHGGFEIVSSALRTPSLRKLLWTASLLTFFLSAILDNLTSAIVMVSVVRKLVRNADQRLFFAGMIVIAANAGGAWSPLGDVTTTMLWISGNITAGAIMPSLILPSLICLLIPLVAVSITMKGTIDVRTLKSSQGQHTSTRRQVYERNIMLATGLSGLIMVPVFTTLTKLPPFMGMLLSLGIIWTVSEIIHRHKDTDERRNLSAAHALSKIDTPSILFFLGILLAIGALQSAGLLKELALFLDASIGNKTIISSIIGVLSAIIDNVPLMAAAMAMYDLADFPTDSHLWHFLAYTCGTGGSMLIIGSAAGVAVMGMERIQFGWYLRRIGPLALLGYVAGALCYLAMYGFHI